MEGSHPGHDLAWAAGEGCSEEVIFKLSPKTMNMLKYFENETEARAEGCGPAVIC